MTYFQAIVLAIVQGLTEFIPVSSSGHLVLLPALLHWPDQGLFFDVMLHTGSLLALIVYFRHDLVDLLQALLRPRQDQQSVALMKALFIAFLPIVLFAFLLEDAIDSTFRSPSWVGVFLLMVGLIIILTPPAKRTKEAHQLSWLDSLLIGLAQGAALLPGVSRSGSTIFAGSQCGLSHREAARFSFLLGIPAILGATAKQLLDTDLSAALERSSAYLYLTAFLISALTSYAAIHTMLAFLRQRSLRPFAVYMTILGIFVLLIV